MNLRKYRREPPEDRATLEELWDVYFYADDFSLFRVRAENEDGCNTFYSTGIRLYRGDAFDIRFLRFGSRPVLLPGCVSSAAIDGGGKIRICAADTQYTLTPITRKADTDTGIKKIKINEYTLPEFMRRSAIDTDSISVDDRGVVYMSVDVRKLSIHTLKRERAFKQLMDICLNGAAEEYQCCRVPAFSVMFCGDDCIICGHIYNYPEQTYLNTVPLYDSSVEYASHRPLYGRGGTLIKTAQAVLLEQEDK